MGLAPTVLQETLHRVDQLGGFDFDGSPDNVPTHLVIGVNQAVPCRGNCSPRQIGNQSAVSRVSRLAASPTTSTRFTWAREKFASASKSARVRAEACFMAARARSRMSRSRALSSDTLHLGRVQHRLSEMAAQFLRHLEVHLTPAKQGRQAHLQACISAQPRDATGRKLSQHVDVAVGPEVVPKRRAEHRQLGNPVGPAELCQLLLVDRDLSVHDRAPILQGHWRFLTIPRRASLPRWH